MNALDYLLLTIVGLSAVLSLWRGFVREMISLIGLVAAFFIAAHTSAATADWLSAWIRWRALAQVAGFALVFVLVSFAFGLLGALVRKLVDAADLTATDRLLGVLFGIARGVLLIALVFFGYTKLMDRYPSWMQQSRLAPYAIQLGKALGRLIPEQKAKKLLPSAEIPEVDRQRLSQILEQMQRESR